MKQIHWSSDLKETTNQATNKTRYYILNGGAWLRVSPAVYLSRELDAKTTRNVLTRVKNGRIEQYKTIAGVYLTKH